MSSDSSLLASGVATPSSRFTTRLIERLLPRAVSGHLRITLPNGSYLDLGKRDSGSNVTLTVHRWRALWRTLLSGEAGFSSGYIAGDWSTGDLVGVLDFLMRNEAAFAPAAESRLARIFGCLRHRANDNTRTGSRRNIAAHYDLGNAFYRHWLDQGMNYSSAIYPSDLSLEAAQQYKLERISQCLDLKGGERVLEIGCGWGAMAEHLVRRFGSTVTGVTLSESQLDYARDRLSAEIAAGHAAILFQDYRDIAGRFDRIVSIEMFEAVGERYWPVYFEKLRSSLVQDGAAVLQIITIASSRFDAYRKRPDFIQRHIFPGGMLPTTEIIEDCAAKAALKVTGRESFGPSYARTLREWRHRFLARWQDIESLGFDTRFRRMWEYYLAYCEVGFLHGAIDVSLFKLTH
ncbi:methyltransferase, cyclopropane fatty acid synthase [Bradyrhizobium sp. YR681]|uniref:SAM-dependent methyltransferase n=1 Tax=Bradyrhizobium sp. YR681 TaxID=1144344 RepID=UPI0002711C11|nr:cyclopropane-fatty-acyl-phospholipid synthase family protein [Bradyrhizobium sp. YR681]EJN12338.1 methyltransferase, cyclopropane fatty acid synthase [Bradyrhizobium sp. YR681]